MIQLNFTFADVSHAKAFLNSLDDESKAAVQEALAPSEAPPVPESTPAAKKSPGRPKKEVAAAAATPAAAQSPEPAPSAAQPPAAVAAATSPPAPVVNNDTIRATAEAVVAKLGPDVGMSKAREIIRKFGSVDPNKPVLTIRDIPLDKCAAVNAELLKL